MSIRPLRIAVWYNFPSGGAKRALYNQLAGLKSRGHHLEVFRPPVGDLEHWPIRDVSHRETEFDWPSWQKDSWFYPLKLKLASEEVFRYVASADHHARMVGAEIRKGQFDLLFSHSCMFFASPFVGRYVDLPKVLYLHEPKRVLYEPSPRLPWLARDPLPFTGLKKLKAQSRERVEARSAAVRAREELINARAFDRILVNSYFSRESVLRAYGLNSRVCYLGIDSGMFKNLNLRRENYVIGVGMLVEPKNQMFVIESIGRIPKEIRPELIWVGNVTDPVYRDACAARATELGVVFSSHNMVTDEELVSLLNRAVMSVYAPRLEPFGFAPLEANLCGLPVVAVAEGGVRETVIDGVNGRLVDQDPALFADAVVRLLQDDAFRINLGKQGAERALSHWGLEQSIDRLEAELYDTLNAKAHV